MTENKSGVLNRRDVLALRGLRLPKAALQRMNATGVHCDPAVSIEWQAQSQRYVIRGAESGGSVQNLGAYCGFVDVDGNPLRCLQEINSLRPNGLHGIVVSPQMVRLQVFRNERTYQLLITEHRLETVPGRKRPALRNTVLFRGKDGVQPSGSADGQAGIQWPVFYTQSGEESRPPKRFEWAARGIMAASWCQACQYIFLLKAPLPQAGIAGEESVTGPNSGEVFRP
jgi:hypothetical protein